MKHFHHLAINRLHPNIAILQINRGEAKNALNSEIVYELTDAVQELNELQDIVSVILTGDQIAFAAGADVKELVGLSVSQSYELAKAVKGLHEAIICSPKPYIAVINGYCLGGGLELALACDIRLASPSAKFGFPEINLGIIPGGGGISRLTEITGMSIASQMIFTGEIITAEKALELNIVSSIHEDILEEAKLLAYSISRKSKLAIAAAKRLINRKHLQINDLHLEQEIYEFSLLFDYPDSVEGLGAFIEKRVPSFKGQGTGKWL